MSEQFTKFDTSSIINGADNYASDAFEVLGADRRDALVVSIKVGSRTGTRFVDIRKMYPTRDGSFGHAKQGVTLNPDALLGLVEALLALHNHVSDEVPLQLVEATTLPA